MDTVIILLVIAQLPTSTIQSGHLPTHSRPNPIYQHDSMSHSNRILAHRSVQIHQDRVGDNWDHDYEADMEKPIEKHAKEHPPPFPHSSSPALFPRSLHALSRSRSLSAVDPDSTHPHSPSTTHSPPHHTTTLPPPHHTSTHPPLHNTSTSTHVPPHKTSTHPPSHHTTTHPPPHHTTTHPPPHHTTTHPPPHHTSTSTHSPAPHPPKPTTTKGYDCDKHRYNCTGPGLFSDPKDHTIFFRCRFKPEKNRYRATCFTCNWKFKKCFNRHVNACLPCDQTDHKKDKVHELISQKTSYDCSGYEAFACSQLGFGLHEHPGDKSISVHCTNDTGEWLGGCITCPRNKYSCFIEGLGQCVENCADNQNHTYDCSHYKVDPKIPCKEKGKFGMIGRSTTYFECKEDGSGKILPTCKPCPKNQYFDKVKKECTAPQTPTTPPPPKEEDNSTETLQARARGNSRRKPSKLAIPRFTTTLHNYRGYGFSIRPNPEKLFITAPFLSHDCKKVSYICKGQGVFVNPMDPSVWFECTMDRKINKWKPRCRECPKHTCFNPDKRTCVNTCKAIEQSWFTKCRDKWTDKCEQLLSMG